MDLIDISSAGDLLAVNHPHFGKLQNLGFIKRTLGILTGTSRKADALEDYSSGQQQSVALHVDAQNFMITIADAFVLVTLREGSSRHPVILKKWKIISQKKDFVDLGGVVGLGGVFGTINTYVDSDGLRWEHGFGAPDNKGFFVGCGSENDILIGCGSNGERILSIALETIR